ncbi:class I SAM-dependent methyltransferase [Flocculibacter collagenilyticus]|uniref:class I SAM-dependent methyltransferase n=1 Tax=Flocculibacter collagenilyticus TaxID=2744479 RepID=UPI0018F64731|nr:class I SAM-dependent methyltransferase [Flocculibacter collagenilyticus]
MDYLAVNKQTWDERTKIHVTSDFYDVEGFISGKSSLNEIELTLIGDVNAKSLLHLQCHFGLDTLSWARLGAKTTGVDLSSEAIDKATSLASDLKLDANFVCSDVFQFNMSGDAKYDIVYTSYGVLCWLPDLTRWAETISRSLKQGGKFYLVEFHPVMDLLSGYSYFSKDTPDIEEEATYTENSGDEALPIVTWTHTISEVVNALVNAGIDIEAVDEYPYSPYECYEGLVQAENDMFKFMHKGQLVPLTYSIKGVKR